MKKTAVVLVLFLAALLTGVFMRFWGPSSPVKCGSDSESEDGKERFFQREIGMPLDMQAVAGRRVLRATTARLPSWALSRSLFPSAPMTWRTTSSSSSLRATA